VINRRVGHAALLFLNCGWDGVAHMVMRHDCMSPREDGMARHSVARAHRLWKEANAGISIQQHEACYYDPRLKLLLPYSQLLIPRCVLPQRTYCVCGKQAPRY
jgi:hypothetical protein